MTDKGREGQRGSQRSFAPKIMHFAIPLVKTHGKTAQNAIVSRGVFSGGHSPPPLPECYRTPPPSRSEQGRGSRGKESEQGENMGKKEISAKYFPNF